MINRLVVKNTLTGEEKILHLSPEQEKNESHFIDSVTNVQLEVIEKITLVEWLATNYKSFGAALEFVHTGALQENCLVCMDRS